MLKVPPPAGKSIGPQRKQSTLIFSDGINVYTLYDVARSIYGEN